jgi:polyhydroxyalkanoate synthesis regulator protein
MGPYLERSLQVFLDQQQQFRNQLNSMMGQTPWALLNELTERNLDAWKNMQRGFMDAASQASPPPGQAGRGTTTKKP